MCIDIWQILPHWRYIQFDPSHAVADNFDNVCGAIYDTIYGSIYTPVSV